MNELTIQESVIRSIPLFSNLPQDELGWLTGVAIPMQFLPGQIVFFEGDRSDFLGIVLSGQVEIIRV